MKRLFLTFAILGGLLLSSCSTVEEVCYSCDSEIDAWVKSNKTELNNMSREDLSKLDIPHQQAALRMFTPKRKKQLWTEKYNEVLHNNNFSKEELKHLLFVSNFIKTKDFSKTNTKEEDEIMFEWLKKSMDDFGWSKEFLYDSFFTYGVIKTPYKTDQNKKVNPGRDLSNCNCRWWCWGWWQSCYGGGCDETNGGCGMIGSSDCTGDCS